MCPRDIDFLNSPLNSSKWLILSAAIYIKKETGDSAMMFITGTSPGGSTVKPDSEYGTSFSSAGIDQLVSSICNCYYLQWCKCFILNSVIVFIYFHAIAYDTFLSGILWWEYYVGLQQRIDKIDYYRLWKSSTTFLIID